MIAAAETTSWPDLILGIAMIAATCFIVWVHR